MERLALTTIILYSVVNSAVTDTASAKPPHIILVVADDLGWNDVSWNNPSMLTPNLAKLAQSGVILNQYYVQPLCTPSRTALMTGYYPYHVGLQHLVIVGAQPNFLPANYTLLPQRLKTEGYATHMVGKWHLGFCNWNYTPTYRGFDSFLGYYQGMEDYYTHSVSHGYDFRFNEEVYKKNVSGEYSSVIFGNRAEEIINSHNASAGPLFLYLPFQSVHSPNEVPEKYYDMYPDIEDKTRRTYCGMVSALDDAFGKIVQALTDKAYLDNAVIIFTTDNGGLPNAGGNNYPLRGAKSTLWEGGTRGPAFVYSKTLLKHSGAVNNEMMHIVDWNPTIQHIAGLQPEADQDGISQWDMISRGGPSKRKEFVYNIDNMAKNGAIRVGDYKLIKGNPGRFSGWYPPPGVSGLRQTDDSLSVDPDSQYRLFNLKDDPNEHVDLAQNQTSVLKEMVSRLQELTKSETPARFPLPDPRGLPEFHGGVWSPGWC